MCKDLHLPAVVLLSTQSRSVVSTASVQSKQAILNARLHTVAEALILQLAQHDGGEGVAVAGHHVITHAAAAVDMHQRRLSEVRPHLRRTAGMGDVPD